MNPTTQQQIKKLSRKLFDPNTPNDELEQIVMTLAHTRQPEALQVLEEFEHSSRAKDVEWVHSAIDECIYALLTPMNEKEEKDYNRVEIWQSYEDELIDMEEELEDALMNIQQLEVENEFLLNLRKKPLKDKQKWAVDERLSGMDEKIQQEENTILNLTLKIERQKFLIEQIEKAIESPIYRKYGKEYIGMELFEDDEDYIYDEDLEDEDLPF